MVDRHILLFDCSEDSVNKEHPNPTSPQDVLLPLICSASDFSFGAVFSHSGLNPSVSQPCYVVGGGMAFSLAWDALFIF